MKIYAIKIEDELDGYLREELLSFVDKSKRERLLKFVFNNDLQRGLFADLLVRKVLIEEYGLNNEDIHFSINEFGKPYCEFINDFHFNLSHSGDWVVCAIDNNPIGIDIEKISRIDLDISKNFLSGKEHKDLLSSNDPHDYFFTLWSLKESYVKFIGKGLSHPLNSFSMLLTDNNISIESNGKVLENVYFKQYKTDGVYKLAVCSSSPYMPEEVLMLTSDELIEIFMTSTIVN